MLILEVLKVMELKETILLLEVLLQSVVGVAYLVILPIV
jgi:hypothetical protein